MCNYKLTLALLIGLLLCPNVSFAQTVDEPRSVANNFFAAYQRKDVDGLIALWDAKAPDLATFTTDTRKTFSAAGGAELKSFEIRRITVDGTTAVVRVLLTELKTGNRTLRLTKSDGQWKVWQYEPSERELAVKLISAKTESEQEALVKAEPELITVDLVQELRKQAEGFQQRRDFSQALVAFRLTRSTAERFADEQTVAVATFNMGVVYYSLGEYQQALQMFQQHLMLGVVSRDRALTARTLNAIGAVKRSMGDTAGALDYFRRSQQAAEEAGDKRMLSNALNNIGVIHRDLGEYARALDYFEKGLTLGEALGDKLAMSQTLNNIGTIHGSQGNQTQALVYFKRTLKLGEDLADQAMIANALNNIGLTYYRLKNYPQALDYYQQSLTLREQLKDNRGAALTLNNIGIIHREQGDYKQALDFYHRSLALREKLDDPAGTATVLDHIGIIHYLQGDYDQALQLSTRVLELAKRLENPEILWRGYELAGRAHTALKQFDDAEKDLTNSINTIEKMRYLVGGGELARQRFFEDKLPPYTAMVQLASSRNRPDDALTYSELAKARTLLDVLRNGRIPINKALSPEEQELERKANADLILLNAQIYEERQRPKPNSERLAALEPRREQARIAYESVLTSLYVKHPELKVQRGEAMPITGAEAAALIPDASTAIVEFVVDEDKSYLIVLTGNKRTTTKTTLYPIKITANQLSERVDQFRRMLAERDLNYQDTARELYDLLLKPAEEQLRGRKTLCIVPDRTLWELPFQALQSRTGVHLIEDYTLFYAPSVSVLREVTKQPKGSAHSAKTLLAFGNPQMSGGPVGEFRGGDNETAFGPLPEAEVEVKTLARLYGAARSQIFIGAKAREQVAKTEAPKYEVLHFATHGLLDNNNPMFSFLTLAQTDGDPNEDGILEAREIVNMDLHAKLAVLSACQTAQGRVGAGEGVIGMSWALFVAGVPTTVASQWKVDSVSTTNLMIDFHRRLTKPASSKQSKAAALRQAELGLLRTERYRHPFYWAGFVMIGDGW